MSLAIADALMQPEPDYRERMLYWGRSTRTPKEAMVVALAAGCKATTHSLTTASAMALQCVCRL